MTRSMALLVTLAVAISSPAAAEDGSGSRKALLVIDLQQEWAKQYERQAFKQFVTAVNTIIDHAAQKGLTLIYIRQLGGGDILESVHVKSKLLVDKQAPTAFVLSELPQVLEREGIRELYVVGLDAAYCVFATSESAVNLKYTVHVIEDAVITKKPDRGEVLKAYQERGIPLMTSAEFLRD